MLDNHDSFHNVHCCNPHDFFVLYVKLKNCPIYPKMLIFDKLLDLVKIVGKGAFIIKKDSSNLKCP